MYTRLMEIIAIAESDDCGPFAITDADMISLTKFGDLYLVATRCAYRNTPITSEISEEDAMILIQKGVQCLDIENHNISSKHEES